MNTAKEPIEAIQTKRSIVGSKYYTHVLPRLEEVYKRFCYTRKGADI